MNKDRYEVRSVMNKDSLKLIGRSFTKTAIDGIKGKKFKMLDWPNLLPDLNPKEHAF